MQPGGMDPTLAKANAIAQAAMQGGPGMGKGMIRAPVRPGLVNQQMVAGAMKPGPMKALASLGKPPMQVAKIGYWKQSNATGPSSPLGIRPGGPSMLSKMPTIKPRGPAPLMVPGMPSKAASLGAAGTKLGSAPPMMKAMPGMGMAGPGMGMAGPGMAGMFQAKMIPAKAKAPEPAPAPAAADTATNGTSGPAAASLDTSMKEVSPALAALMSGLDF